MQAEQDWIKAVADKVAYPANRRDFKGPAECDCGTDACAGGRLQLKVFLPGDRQVFRERDEKSQGVTRSMKKKNKPTEKWNEAMLHNLNHNMIDFADKTGWGEDVASIAQAENIHADSFSTAVWQEDGAPKAKAKPKAKGKAKAGVKDRTGDLVTDRDMAKFELRDALETLMTSALRTVGECNDVLGSIKPDESLTGLRNSLITRMACCEGWLKSVDPGNDIADEQSWLDTNQNAFLSHIAKMGLPRMSDMSASATLLENLTELLRAQLE